jgi:hypothetical protein
LKFLLADGVISFYDRNPDLPQFITAIYYQLGNNVMAQIQNAHIISNAVHNRRVWEDVNGRPDRTFYDINGRRMLFVP